MSYYQISSVGCNRVAAATAVTPYSVPTAPSGWMGAQARLYKNGSFYTGSTWHYNSGTSYGIGQNILGPDIPAEYSSRGMAKYWNYIDYLAVEGNPSPVCIEY